MSISKLQPIMSDNILELQEWVRFYDRNGQYPANILERFAIGLYQVYQGMEWKDIINKNESWCAAFLHFLTLAEKLNLPAAENIEDNTGVGFLLYISKAQQDVFYKYNAGKTMRSSRYDEKRLTKNLSKILSICYSKVPSIERAEGFNLASSIMIGKL